MVAWKFPLFTLFAVNLAAVRADACSCALQPIEESFAVADAVFVAKITEITELYTETENRSGFSSTQQATLEVDELFKGPVVQSVTFEVFFPVSDGTCGYPYYVGGTYLIWAKGDPVTGYKASAGADFVGICAKGGSIDNEFLQEELKWLRAR